jgi:hypothetical protein
MRNRAAPGARRGQALAELVVSIMVILLILVGASEISKLISCQQRLASTVREGGRLYVRYKLDGTSSSDIQTKVVTPMLDSIVQPGESTSRYVIIVSSIARTDPNDDTSDYENATQVDDDKLVIENQYIYGTGQTSKVGSAGTIVGAYSDTSKLLDLDFLKLDERTALIEVYRTATDLSSFSGLIPGLKSLVLYEKGVY